MDANTATVLGNASVLAFVAVIVWAFVWWRVAINRAAWATRAARDEAARRLLITKNKIKRLQDGEQS